MTSLTPWKRVDQPRNGGLHLSPVSPMTWNWDRMFDGLFPTSWSTSAENENIAPLDVTESSDQFLIRVELPGIAPEDIDISLDGDLLTITGEKREEERSSEGGQYYSERKYGAHKRVVRLSSPVDSEKVVAEHKHGVLTISLRKAETHRPKRIQVNPT